MKRWCFSPVIGNGQSIETAIRVAVADVANTNTNAIIPSDPQTGLNLHPFAFCRVATANIVPVKEVSNVYVFPDASMDHTMGSIGSDPINDTESVLFAMRQAIIARNLSVDYWLSHPTRTWDKFTYREVLLGIVQQHEQSFSDMDSMDVVEPIV